MREAARRRVPEPERPARIGARYQVEETLGKGGMGAVYRVLDEANPRIVEVHDEEIARELFEAGGVTRTRTIT